MCVDDAFSPDLPQQGIELVELVKLVELDMAAAEAERGSLANEPSLIGDFAEPQQHEEQLEQRRRRRRRRQDRGDKPRSRRRRGHEARHEQGPGLLPRSLLQRPRAATSFVETLDMFSKWGLTSREQSKGLRALRVEMQQQELNKLYGPPGRPRTADVPRTRARSAAGRQRGDSRGGSRGGSKSAMHQEQQESFVQGFHDLLRGSNQETSSETEELRARRESLRRMIEEVEALGDSEALPPHVLAHVQSAREV